MVFFVFLCALGGFVVNGAQMPVVGQFELRREGAHVPVLDSQLWRWLNSGTQGIL